MKHILNIASFMVFAAILFGIANPSACAEPKLDIDLDMDQNYRESTVKGDLQEKLEDYDKERGLKPYASDEWLKFHKDEEFNNHTPGVAGNRAMQEEMLNSSRYKGSNLDPMGKDEFDSFGLKGKIDLK